MQLSHWPLLIAGAFAAMLSTSAGEAAGPMRPTRERPQTRLGEPTATKLGARPATVKVVVQHVVDQRRVPAAAPGMLASGPRRLQPFRGISPEEYLAHQLAAEHNPAAPLGLHPLAIALLATTPGTIANFAGMADSKTICPPAGCEPPDMAVAASPAWVFQGVNTAYAVYDPAGNLQAGWPKNAQTFFGIPRYCAEHPPNLTDPRAFYDPIDKRFWAFILEFDGPERGCPTQQYYWIAVSQTSDPNGKWNVYAFDMTAGTSAGTDFTQAGFDAKAVYVSSNMFPNRGPLYAEIFGAPKARMEAGGRLTAAHGFFHLSANGEMLDSVQPALTNVPNASATTVEFFASSFNANFPCFEHCSGVIVWAMAGGDGPSPTLTGTVVPTEDYVAPPLAGNPGCATPCIDASDNRISATPVYSNGFLSFAFETGVDNGTAIVPGIYWLQVQPSLSGTKLSGATLAQSGLVFFAGRQAASYGALVSDMAGNLIMVFDTMDKTLPPGILYAARRPGDPKGAFEPAVTLQAGVRSTTNRRWGDYEAASFDGAGNLWFASQFSGTKGDWATQIGATHF